MPLTLTVRSVERTGTAPPPPLKLDRRGAVIGRAAGTDWTLPDERSTVSSRHCEIGFRGGAYLIADTSTNGTWVNGHRLAGLHQLADGDLLRIGPYEVAASLTAEPAAGASSAPSPAAATQPTPSGAAEPLLRAAGVQRSEVPGADADILAAAGVALREMAVGTAMLLERAARARKELGAADPDGATAAAVTLPKLLGRAPGAVPPERAVAAAFAELDAHQLATLKAMQGAMKATLDRFAPGAIRARSAGKGDAALWQEYERAFTTGENAFVEVFARELLQSYQALAKRSG
jgi:predicted component of type VI protein secretion system